MKTTREIVMGPDNFGLSMSLFGESYDNRIKVKFYLVYTEPRKNPEDRECLSVYINTIERKHVGGFDWKFIGCVCPTLDLVVGTYNSGTRKGMVEITERE